MRFVLPATIIMSLIAVGIFAGYVLWSTPSSDILPGAVASFASATLYQAQTMITTFLVFCALLLLPMTVPPTRFFVGGARLRKDWKMTILAVLLFAGFIATATSHLGQVSFDLAQARPAGLRASPAPPPSSGCSSPSGSGATRSSSASWGCRARARAERRAWRRRRHRRRGFPRQVWAPAPSPPVAQSAPPARPASRAAPARAEPRAESLPARRPGTVRRRRRRRRPRPRGPPGAGSRFPA